MYREYKKIKCNINIKSLHISECLSEWLIHIIGQISCLLDQSHCRIVPHFYLQRFLHCSWIFLRSCLHRSVCVSSISDEDTFTAENVGEMKDYYLATWQSEFCPVASDLLARVEANQSQLEPLQQRPWLVRFVSICTSYSLSECTDAGDWCLSCGDGCRTCYPHNPLQSLGSSLFQVPKNINLLILKLQDLDPSQFIVQYSIVQFTVQYNQY